MYYANTTYRREYKSEYRIAVNPGWPFLVYLELELTTGKQVLEEIYVWATQEPH